MIKHVSIVQETESGGIVHNGVIIYSAKEREIEILQHMFCINGFMTTKYQRYHGFGKNVQYQLSVTDNQTQTVKKKNVKTEVVENEPFWCITVKNQNFFCRRNGRVHLTGNCHSNLKIKQGRMLDVGLDSAYDVLGEHKFFTFEDVKKYMESIPLQVSDHHKVREGSND